MSTFLILVVLTNLVFKTGEKDNLNKSQLDLTALFVTEAVLD